MIAPRTSIAERPHRWLCETQGPPQPDGAGGYTESWLPLDPSALFIRILPAAGNEQSMVPDGTLMSNVTHTVTCPYHPGLTTSSRLRLGTRVLRVTGVVSPEERHVESLLLCSETKL